jgi:hypothetical protein
MQWIFGLMLGRSGSRYIDTPNIATPLAAARDEPHDGVHA